MSKIDDINFGLLTKEEISELKFCLDREVSKRVEKPKNYIEIVFADDACEGMYSTVENFKKIPSKALHDYIIETLNRIGEIKFIIEKIDKEDYQKAFAQYEWQLEDGSNTPVLEDSDD